MSSFVKKIVSWMLLVVFLISFSAPLLVVNAASDHQSHLDTEKPYRILQENLINYTCRYDEKNDKVLINGTVTHDVMVSHREYFLEVYAIAPGQSIDSAIFSQASKSKASMEIAIKFDFSISALTTADRFSLYAVVLRSPDGLKTLGAEPQYIYIASSYEYNALDKSAYKGISSEFPSQASAVNVGTVILPVYLNRLLSENAGYMYSLGEDGVYYFDRSYVDTLDATVKTYSASGAKVYFQLLLEAVGSDLKLFNGQSVNASYDFPDLSKPENLQRISAAAEFLADRYDEKQDGILSGLVVGSSIDLKMKNYTVGLSLEDYAERYAFYLLTVSSSARMKNAALDVLIPFSEVDTYSDPDRMIYEGDYSPSLLLEEILSVLDDRVSGSFACGTMIESSALPLTWLEVDEEKTLIVDESQMNLTPATISAYTAYLNELQKTNIKAPSHFIYRWNAPSSADATTMACNYAYTYYTLLRYEDVSSFVVSFDESMTKEFFSEISQLLRYIDTGKGTSITEPLLPFFGVQRWDELVTSAALSVAATQRVYRLPSNAEALTSYLGSFEYFDFSSGSIEDWTLGVGTKKLKFDLFNNDSRGLYGVMNNDPSQGASELLCLYEFSENFIYTPYLKLSLALPDVENALYQITVSLGNGNAMILADQFVWSGDSCEIWLDLREIPAEDLMAEYIKISAELVEGDAEEFSLWVLGLTGYSQEYTSEELTELISEERLRIRNENADDQTKEGAVSVLWIVFGVLLLVSSLVAGVLLFFHRKEEDEEDQDKEADASNKK